VAARGAAAARCKREVDVTLADEIHLVFSYYRSRGFPEAPDRALARPLAPAGYDERRYWYEKLKPDELARLREAINGGARA